MKKLAFGVLLAVMTLLIGPTAGKAEAASCYVFNNDLSYGMTFGEVLELQKFLATDGSFTVELTGTFGPLTRAALAQYQAKNGIQATGFFGPATRARVNASGCGQVLGAFAQASTVSSATQTGKLSILDPRGSTTWQIGDIYPISWYPGSNSANMDAFLEIKKGTAYEKVARLITNPGTAGSLSWGGQVDNTPATLTDNSGPMAKPAKYFVSIADRVTGQVARTGSQVNVVKYGDVIKMKATAHPDTKTRVEAKTEGQTPVTVKDGNIVLSWSANADSCQVYAEAISELVPNEDEYYVSYDNEKRHVTKKSFALPGGYEEYSVQVNCRKGPHTDVREFEVKVNNASSIQAPILDSVQSKAAEPNEIFAGEVALLYGSNLNANTRVYVDNDGDKYYFETRYNQTGVIELLSIDLPAGTDNEFMLYAENRGKVSKPLQVEYRQPVAPLSLTVVYPNGGEKLLFGAKDVDMRVRWNTTGDLNGEVGIYVHFEDGGTCFIGKAPAAQHEFAATLGSNYKCPNLGAKYLDDGDRYKVSIYANNGDPEVDFVVKDSSDNFFSIVNAGNENGSCVFTRDLAVGSEGDDVGYLQNFLQQRGFMGTVGEDKYYFGTMTQAALAKYQTSVGISPANGYFGPVTRALVTSVCSSTGGTLSAELAAKDVSLIGSNDSIGQFDFELDLTAANRDLYVGLSAGRGTSTPGQAFSLVVLDGNNNLVTTGKMTFSAAANPNETSNNRIRVYEGQTERFILTAFYQPVLPGTYKVRLVSINYAESDTVPDKVLPLGVHSTFTSTTQFISPIKITEARASTLTANTAAYSHISTIPNLSVGMTDPGVAAIQRYLNANGFPVGTAAGQPGSVGYESSYFGPATQRALAAFQAAKGISPANGAFGPQTRAAMTQ